MKIIVCLDDHNGMAFNHRRQSRDRMVISDILSMVGESPIYMSEYSAVLFADSGADCLASADFLERVEDGEWCFIEISDASSVLDRMEALVVYRWNRHYPSDLIWNLNEKAFGLRLVERSEFAGYSHETITKEIFKK